VSSGTRNAELYKNTLILRKGKYPNSSGDFKFFGVQGLAIFEGEEVERKLQSLAFEFVKPGFFVH
jgi:hypothetical protein